MVELILSGALIACTTWLGFVARRLKREPDAIWEVIAIAIGLALLTWTPSWVRSTLVGGFAVLAVWELGIGFVIAMLALVVAIAIWLPGGVSVVMFAILAIVGVGQIRAARRHLVRISRAATLVANQRVEQEVELTGTAHAIHPTIDPVFGGTCAIWRVVAEGTRDSDTMVEIRGPRGSALVDPTTVQIDWSRPPRVVRGDDARRAAELLRLELRDDALSLYVLPDGTECYVMGLPTWETAPADTVGLYRDSHMLPTFRTTPEHPAMFSDRSEAQLRSDYLWALASWGTWSVVSATICVLQLVGWS